MSALEMRVNMDCAGCENKIRKALKKVKGVDDVDIDMEMQKVTVMGWAEQEKIFKAIRKTGRNVEMWPYPYNPESLNYYREYYNYQQPQPVIVQTQPITYYYAPGNSNTSYQNVNRYNYYYSEENYGYYRRPPYSTMDSEQASSVFSEENPHACSIM